MIQWYLHDPVRGRTGPFDDAQLRAAWTRREVHGHTLAWRNGMPGWRPLAEFAVELGLSSRSGPPPLPVATPASPPLPHAVPPRKMSGCAIAVIVAAGLLVLLVPILAIVAAVALPAYQDYTHRARVAGALAGVSPLKAMVADHWAQNGDCPRPGSPGFDDLDDFRGPLVTHLQLDAPRKGGCVIELVFGGEGAGPIAGDTLRLSLAPGAMPHWDCSGGSLPDRYRPGQCQGADASFD